MPAGAGGAAGSGGGGVGGTAGSGTTADAGPDGAPVVAATDVAEQLTAAFCDGLGKACATVQIASDRAKCTAKTRAQIDTALSGVLSRKDPFHPSALDGCLESIALSFPADGSAGPAWSIWAVDECRALFDSSLGADALCVSDVDCPNATSAVYMRCSNPAASDGTGPARCKPYAVPTPGLCPCPQGCVGTRCRRAPLGGVCVSDDGCLEGVCSNEPCPGCPSTCVMGAPLGAACGGQGSGERCGRDGHCPYPELVCTPTLPLGADCKLGPTHICAPGDCLWNGVSGSGVGVCASYLTPGACHAF